MRSSGARSKQGRNGKEGASFWEVRGTFDLMKMLALQVKCCEAQPSAFIHTNTHIQAGRGTLLTHTLTHSSCRRRRRTQVKNVGARRH